MHHNVKKDYKMALTILLMNNLKSGQNALQIFYSNKKLRFF